MGVEEQADLDQLLASVRQIVGPLPAQSPSGPHISLKDVRPLLDSQHKAASERGEREERQAIRDKEERDAAAKAKVDAENRRHMRIALYVAAAAIFALIAFFYSAADTEHKAKISDQTLAAVFGAVTGAAGYFFGSKEKKKD